MGMGRYGLDGTKRHDDIWGYINCEILDISAGKRYGHEKYNMEERNPGNYR
jgi:hypothetical protein